MNVKEAANMLDRYDPIWFDKIDTDELDLELTRYCILAQLCDGYYGGHPKFESWGVMPVFNDNLFRHSWKEEIGIRKQKAKSGESKGVVTYRIERGSAVWETGSKEHSEVVREALDLFDVDYHMYKVTKESV